MHREGFLTDLNGLLNPLRGDTIVDSFLDSFNDLIELV